MKSLQQLLNFEETNNAPVMTCNGCGKHVAPKYMATLYPFEDNSQTYDIVACDDQCKEKLLSEKVTKQVNTMIFTVVADISTKFGLNVNDEWHQYFQQINQ